MVEYLIKINGKKYPFLSVSLLKKVKSPEEFEVELPTVEDVNIGSQVEVYREKHKVFSGLVERKTLTLKEDGLNLKIWGRDLSQKLFHKLTNKNSWSKTKIKTILQEILADTGLTVGEIQDPLPVWHRWFQTSDTDFSNDSLTDVVVSGTGEDAKVILDSTPKLDSQQTDTSYGNDVTTTRWRADNFTVQNSGWINKVELYLLSVSSSTITVSIRSNLTGLDLCSASTTITSANWYEFTFPSPIYVNKNEAYYLVVRVASGDIAYWYGGTAGTCWVSDDSGSTWTEVTGNQSYKIYIQHEKGKIVSTLIQPTNWIKWLLLKATTVLNNQTITFDILDSADNVLVSGITPNQLPYDISGLTQTAIKVRANLSTTDRLTSPELHEWLVSFYADYVDFTVDNEAVFDAVKRLAELVNAEFWVDQDGKFYFKLERGSDLSSNLTLDSAQDYFTVEWTVDGVKLSNKIKVIGAGEPPNRIEVFEEDIESQSVYGLREIVKVDKDIEESETARTYAINLLNLHKNPVEYLTLNLLPNKTFDVGDKITVKCNPLNLNKAFRVKKLQITFNKNIEVWKVELGEEPPSLIDEILKTRVIERWLK